jgi:hypothetical protein
LPAAEAHGCLNHHGRPFWPRFFSPDMTHVCDVTQDHFDRFFYGVRSMAPMGAWLPWSEMTEKVSVFVAASFIGWFKGTLLGSLIPKKKIKKKIQDCMFRERHFVWENTVFSCMDHDSRGWNCNRAPIYT